MSTKFPNNNSTMTQGTRTTSAWIVSPDIQKAVDKYIEEDPNRHKIASRFGQFLVDHPLSSSLDEFKVNGRDLAGEEIKFKQLEKLMSYYGVRPAEMNEGERAILVQKLGPNWSETLKQTYGFTDDDF
jgi:hypothetical protein